MTNSAMSHQYLESQIASAAPEEVVLMLYDGAVRFLRSAIIELEKNNILEKAKLIEKSVSIIEYLKSCLDMEKGCGIAFNLDRLYDYMLIQLTEANMKNDRRKIEEVISLILPIRDGWSRICTNGRTAHAQEQAVTGLQPLYAPALPEHQQNIIIPSGLQFVNAHERITVKV